MAHGWRTVRVFISSTFKDMQAERDHLVRFVFPRLREQLLKRRMHLADVDLRWGVTAEQDALEVCREIIDECRPRFMCMLGGRYGWTPPDQERSITADEVHYAALDDPDRDLYQYFYFRDPEGTASIPEDAARAAGYREFPTEADIEEYGPEEAGERARWRERKLAALKREVAQAGLPVFEYPCQWDEDKQRLAGLEGFGERVYQDLMDSIDDELGEEVPEELDGFAEENAAMEASVEERTQRYVVGSRQALLDEMTEFAEGDAEPSVLVVTGEPGSGKSALLGKFYRDYADTHSDETIIPHFVGASQGSTSVRQTLRRLCQELAQASRSEAEVPEDVKELVQAFPTFLQEAASAGRVAIIIDALNQLDAADNAHTLNWLPRELPEDVRVVVSSLVHPALEALRRRKSQVREVVCAPLTAEDSGAIMDGFLERYHKRFDEAQREALLGKAEVHSPLYLLVALEELRTLGTYEEITNRMRELPDTVTELFDWILRRLQVGVEGQEAFGEELVSAYTSYIAIGRGGMTEGELEALCEPVDEEDEFWVLHRMLRPYLMRRGEPVDYFHGQLREAVERRYSTDDATRQQRHRDIAEHLHGRGYEYVRTLSELPYHLTQAAMWEELEGTLTTLKFLEQKAEAGMVFDLAPDFAAATMALPAGRPWARTVRLLGQALSVDVVFTSRHPSALFQCLWNQGWWYDCDQAANHYEAPEGGWGPQGAPWERPEPRLCTLLEAWREEKEARDPGCVWLRSLRPPPSPTGGGQIACLRGHETFVYGVDFCRDGLRVASGCDDGTVRVWDASTGVELVCLRGHTHSVWSVAFSPDGGRIVSGSWDGTVRVWDADTGDELACLRRHEGKVHSVAFSPDGRQIVSGSSDETVRVWDADTGDGLACLRGHAGDVLSVAVLPDGGRIVSGLGDGTVRVWDAESGAELACLHGHEDRVTSVAFSPDGSRIVSGGWDKTVRVWDASTAEEIICLRGHEDSVWGVAFSPDGSRIVSGSWDKTVRVWDAATGDGLACLRGHQYRVWGVAFSPDGSRIVSGSWDLTVRVWDAATGDGLARLRGHEDEVRAVAFSPDGERIVSGAFDFTVRVWNTIAGEEIACLRVTDFGMSVAFSPHGDRIVARGMRGTVQLWDADTMDEMARQLGHEGKVRGMAFSPDGRRIVSGSEDRTVRVWDAHSGEQIACLHGHEGEVRSMAFSPDGRRIVSGSEDRTVRVWDAYSEEQIACLHGHEGGVRGVAFSPDGQRVVSYSWVSSAMALSWARVRVWDAERLECLQIIEGTHALEVIAGGPEYYRWRTVGRGVDTVVEDAATGREVAWFPLVLREIATHPCGCIWAGAEWLASYLAVFVLEGPPLVAPRAPRTTTATRLWLFGEPRGGHRILSRLEGALSRIGLAMRRTPPGHWDDKLTATCPFHGGRFEVTEMMLGEEAPCPECGETLKLNPFVCDNADRY